MNKSINLIFFSSEKQVITELPLECKKIQKSDRQESERQENNVTITEIPHDALLLILSYSDAPTLTKLACTCRFMYYSCISFNKKWKSLCLQDFNVYLTTVGKFPSYYDIYRLLYCSRLLLGALIYSRYFSKIKNVVLPTWLMVWAALSQHPPIMTFGKHRIKRRITGHYFKRFNDIPYGQIKKIFKIDIFDDLLDMRPTRIERGTMYFSWSIVRFAGIRKYGIQKYEQYLLDKCYRARGFIERNYRLIQGSDPLNII
ncbi:uncharacterized protein LOC136073706 [Hydra vulgaris]|uniref:uncharacterized protein LOC136073706 n=1 Tax=Hydra vulgaris TaxID=6087 RepID=UPI0032E9D31B